MCVWCVILCACRQSSSPFFRLQHRISHSNIQCKTSFSQLIEHVRCHVQTISTNVKKFLTHFWGITFYPQASYFSQLQSEECIDQYGLNLREIFLLCKSCLIQEPDQMYWGIGALMKWKQIICHLQTLETLGGILLIFCLLNFMEALSVFLPHHFEVDGHAFPV